MTSPAISKQVNTSETSDKLLVQAASASEGTGDNPPESNDCRSEESSEEDVMQNGEGKEGEDNIEVCGNNFASSNGNDDEEAEREASKDVLGDEEPCRVNSDTIESDH